MRSGQFFELDNTSYLHKGEVVFRYTKVQSDRLKPSYPIYLSFSTTRIDFYYHGYINIEKKDSSEFIETNILSLPLTTQASVVNELNRKLETVFDEIFPVTRKNYLCAENKENRYPAYSNLPCFNLSKKKNSSNKILLRELLLDFIFDLQHTDLFKASPFFENAKKLLKESLFFEAIASKAKYYYFLENAKLFLESNKEVNPEKSKGLQFNISVANAFKGEFEKSKMRWQEILQIKDTEKVIDEKGELKIEKLKFIKQNYWFDNIELELFNLHRTYSEICNVPFYENKSSSISWFIDRYSFFRAIRPFFSIWSFIILFILSLVLPIFVFVQNWEEYPIILNIFFFVDLFLLSFFLLSIFYLLFFKLKGSLSTFFRLIIFNLIVILSSAWLVIFNTDIIFKILYHLPLSYKTIIATVLILIITLGIIYSVERESRPVTNRTRYSLIKSLLLIFIALFYAVNINIIGTTIFGSERFSKEKFISEEWRRIINNKGNSYINTSKIIFVDSLKNYTDRELYNSLSEVSQKKSNQKIMYRYKIFSQPFDIFQGMLVLGTAISIFFGLFIQVIVSRRPITG